MQNTSSQVSLFLAITALVSGLIYPPMAAYLAVYVTLGAMLIAVGLHWHEIGHVISKPPYVLVVGASVLYLLTEPFRWQGPDDLVILAVFFPTVVGVGLATLLRTKAAFTTPLMLGSLCLVGAASGCVVALNDIFVLGLDRAGGGNNPIHFAGLTVTLGFMSLVGSFGTKSIWRFVFLAGPVLAAIAVLLSGTRGAVMTILLVTTMLAVAFCFWQRSVKPILLAATILVVVSAVGFVLEPNLAARAEKGFSQSIAAAQALLFATDAGEIPAGVDLSTDVRIAMIRSAWQAFLEAPFFGHGAGQIITATRPYYPERYSFIDAHLHSDMADLMVAGGIVGILSYLALLLAPIATFWMTRDKQSQKVLVVGAICLSGTFFGTGMTNAVFGVLPQSTLFGVLLAWLVAFALQTGEDKT